MENSSKYRPDIDGLRAVAILPVIIFHAANNILPGGYLGVDIFFVISGYLISGLIISGLSNGKFSFGNFYYRRLKRLMPAYIVMILAVLAVGLVILTPRELMVLAKTALASVFSVSNMQLALSGDYFAPDTASNALMHTWSLAIEEQFYLGFPLVAWALFNKSTRAFGGCLLIILSISLIIGIYLEFTSSPWAHYSPLARAWQMAAGCGLALFHALNNRFSSRIVSEVSTLGALLLIFSLFIYSDKFVPGIGAAILTTISTLALLHFGRSSTKTFVGRLLSLKIFIWIGLISYSTYLWHQPIIAFAKLFELSDGAFFVPIVTLASLAVGWLSWRLIETPGRFSGLPHYKFLPRMGVGLVLAATVSSVIIVGNGISKRFPEDARLSAFSFSGAKKSRDCGFWTKPNITQEDLCQFPATGDTPSNIGTVAIWGDSHAAGLIGGFIVTEHEFPIIDMAFHGCPVGEKSRNLDKLKNCKGKNDVSLQYLADHPEVQTVIIHARWEFSLDDNYHGINIQESSLETIRAISDLGRDIIIVDSVPVHRREVLPTHNRNISLGIDPVQLLPIEDYRKRLLKHPREFLELSNQPNITFVSLEDLFCDAKEQVCRSHDTNGIPLYEDEGHLNSTGTKIIADYLVDTIISKQSFISQ